MVSLGGRWWRSRECSGEHSVWLLRSTWPVSDNPGAALTVYNTPRHGLPNTGIFDTTDRIQRSIPLSLMTSSEESGWGCTGTAQAASKNRNMRQHTYTHSHTGCCSRPQEMISLIWSGPHKSKKKSPGCCISSSVLALFSRSVHLKKYLWLKMETFCAVKGICNQCQLLGPQCWLREMCQWFHPPITIYYHLSTHKHTHTHTYRHTYSTEIWHQTPHQWQWKTSL